jgi:hypothetical protein
VTQLVDFPARSAGRALIVLQGTESGVLASFSDLLALAAAVSGVVGTIILFAASYAATDRKMRHRQRIGVAFLCLSFVLQAAMALLV